MCLSMLSACESHPRIDATATSIDALLTDHSDAPGHFAPVRTALMELADDAFDYNELCLPIEWYGKQRTLVGGDLKHVCHLKQFPKFALLFADQPGHNPHVYNEVSAMTYIREESTKREMPIRVAPFDAVLFGVPCSTWDAKKSQAGRECLAFIEAWFDPSEYEVWRGIDELKVAANKLLLSDAHASIVRERLCTSLSNIHAFADGGVLIDDLQGFIATNEQEVGTVIVADPFELLATPLVAAERTLEHQEFINSIESAAKTYCK